MSRPQLPVALLAVGIGLAGIVGCQSLHIGTLGAAEEFEPGQRPPDFLFQDLNGASHTLSQYQGRVVILHFWATWCPYCRGEIPKLIEVHQQWSDQGVTVLAVSVDQNRAQLVEFVKSASLPYAVAADRDLADSLARRYHVRGVPTTFIIGRDGRIVATLLGSGDIHGETERALSTTPAHHVARSSPFFRVP